jgi:hypothetical protein
MNKLFLIGFLLIFYFLKIHAASITWIAASQGNWSNPANWSGGTIPSASDIVIFDGTSLNNCDIDVPIDVQGFHINIGYTGIISQNSNIISVGNGNMICSSGIFQGGNANINCNGNFTVNGSTFNSTSSTLSVFGNYTISLGTFNPNSGTIFLNGSNTISGISHSVNNLVLFAGIYNLNTDITVAGILYYNGVSSIFLNTTNGSKLFVQGNIQLLNSSYNGGGNATIEINGNNQQNLTSVMNIGQSSLPKIVLNKPSGNLNISGTISISGNWTYNSGTITGSGSIAFTYGNLLTGLSHTIPRVIFSSGIYNISTDIIVTENLTITGNNHIILNSASSNKIFVFGDISVDNTANNGGGNGTIHVVGNTNNFYNTSSPCGTGKLPNVVFDKQSGVMTIVQQSPNGAMSIGGTYTYLSGTLAGGSPCIFNISSVISNVSCNGGADGCINLNVSGGTPPYTFLWNNAITTQNICGLVAGTYSVTVTDSLANSTQVIFTVIEPSPIVITDNVTNATCNGGCDGEIVISVIGGTPPYQYNWSNGQTAQNVTGACPGTYSVTVVDGSGCAATNVFIVQSSGSGNIAIVGTVTNTVCGQSTGAIDITVTGGTPGYTYTWSVGEVTEDISGLGSGIYRVTVTDASGCTASESFAVSDTGGITLSLVATDIDCINPGSITATFSGGIMPYEINWGDGGISASVTVSPQVHYYTVPGTYTVAISHGGGCTVFATATINDLGVVISLIEMVQPTCILANGKLKIAASGGTPPFTYLWSNGATTDSVVNIAAGTYTVTVTDNAACTATQTFSLTANTQGFTAATGSTSVNCSNGTQGSATVAATAGLPPYTYLWNNGATTQTITGLPAGQYQVTVTDGGGCTLARSVFVNYTSQSFYVFLSVVKPNCNNNGSITATPSNGTPPYSYLWNNSETTQTISNLSPGTYSVTITDGNLCQRIASRTLITSCYNVVKGNIFNDLNGNCAIDSSEHYISGIRVKATNGIKTYYSNSNTHGDYTLFIGASGTFVVSVYIFNTVQCGTLAFCGNNTVSFTSLGDTVNRNIAVSNLNDYNLHIQVSWTRANPGFDKRYVIYYRNSSPISFNDTATITFKYDSGLVYQYSSPTHVAHDIISHTLTWKVNPPIAPYGGGNILCYLHVPVDTPLNYMVHSRFNIEPIIGDCYQHDNSIVVTQIVTGSYDPNEKQVMPEGDIYEEDSVLTYTIHFQNTGNDTTHFVILVDTLSQHLDAASVENIASSHEYSEFDISGEGILTWIFNPLYLPDSNANEPESKGFVMFRVKKKPNLPLNTIISNTASIYFDYNAPIVTNTVENTLTELVGIRHLKLEHLVSVYPNPANNELRVLSFKSGIENVAMLDIAGKTVPLAGGMTGVRRGQGDEVMFNISELSSGLYFVHVTLGNGTTEVKKIVKE